MRSCWEILGIHPTTNEEAIKSSYRDLIKRYHPDTVRAPEKVRRYTIKCAEIIEAYKEAIKYAKAYKEESVELRSEKPLVLSAEYLKKRKNLIFRIYERIEPPLLVIFGILFVLEYVFGIPSFSVIWASFTESVTALPDDNAVKMVIYALFAIISGALVSFVLYIPLAVPFAFIWSNIAGTEYEKYAFKAGFILMIIIYFYVAYFSSLFSHAPFLKHHGIYYRALSETFRLIFCFTAPLYLFGLWLSDRTKYARAKDSFNASALSRIE